MEKDAKDMTREERLAAKLRENLHRRKSQVRAKSSATYGQDAPPLPKTPPKS